MFINKSHRKLTLNPSSHLQQPKYNSFLSPCQKYNHRSFSASHLTHNSNPQKSYSLFSTFYKKNNDIKPKESLYFCQKSKQQMKLDNFKKNVLGDARSKLNKITLQKDNLKNHFQHINQNEEIESKYRNEIRQLHKTIALLRAENQQFLKQKKEDIIFIERQKEAIFMVEQTNRKLQSLIIIEKQKKTCECILVQKNLDKIQAYQLKISHLEQQKLSYKEQIRHIVFKYEKLKEEYNKAEYKLCHYKKAYEESNQKSSKNYNQRRVNQRTPKNYKQPRIGQFYGQNWIENTKNKKRQYEQYNNQEENREAIDDYLDHIKKIRNKEIDQIQNLLKY